MQVKLEEEPLFVGGNITNVMNSLPKLSELGFNSLLLTPWFKGEHYHGYHITDMKEVDPRSDMFHLFSNFMFVKVWVC